MQRIITLIVLIISQVSLFIADPGVTKHALIIAIGDYPEVTGWADISSTNDIELIQGALSKQGFTNFQILRDSQASKALIIKAFNDLKASVRKNDIVVVHFSSHGQQILDIDKDEIDGLDEAIVAYGAPMRYDQGYSGENHLRDEELGALLDDVRLQLGPNGDMLVLLDACHSGTGTRGDAKVRGGAPPFAPRGFQPKPDDNQLGIFEESKVQTRGGEDLLSPMVVISAARAEELNYEYNNYGSLSVAFNKSLDGIASGYSYRSLFSKIVKEMSVIAPNQTPAMEGDVDRQLFGGRVISQDPYYTLRSLSGDYIQVEGGTLTGLNEGTTIKVYPAGTIKTKGIKPLAKGTIAYSETFRASANLDTVLSGSLHDYWVFVDERTFGDIRVYVNTERIKDRAVRKDINRMIEDYRLTVLSDSADFYLSPIGSKFQLIRTRDGAVHGDLISSQNNYEDFKNAISTYAQGKFLKDLDVSNSQFNIELELIPFVL